MKTIKTKQVSLYLDEGEYVYLKKHAESINRSMSSTVGMILEEYFEEENK